MPLMRVFRTVTACALIVCALPVLLFLLAVAAAKLSGCVLQFEEPHACILAGRDIGFVVDRLVEIGVWGAVTLGVGAYIFAGWVMGELAVIIARSLRRPR